MPKKEAPSTETKVGEWEDVVKPEENVPSESASSVKPGTAQADKSVPGSNPRKSKALSQADLETKNWDLNSAKTIEMDTLDEPAQPAKVSFKKRKLKK